MFIDRRGFLKATGAAAATGLISVDAHSQGKPVVNLQLGWLLSGNQIGEVCAKQLGYYEQEGIELQLPGRRPEHRRRGRGGRGPLSRSARSRRARR